MNSSSEGVLLLAHGRFSMVLGIEGKQYRGRLVRASPADGTMTAYAIGLEEVLESPTGKRTRET